MSLLAYADPNIVPAQLPQPRLLHSERMDLERQAAGSLADGKATPPEEIWKAVPQHAVVLQYATYVTPPTVHDKQGEARYLAIAFSSNGVLAAADIGGFDEINALVSSACRAILRDIEQGRHCFRKTPGELTPVPGLKIAAFRLYQTLIAPVAHVLTGARHVIVVPDGPLAFFPFEALVDAGGEYLVRHYLVSYIQSPVEIPRWQQSTPPSHGPPVIVADPDYDAGRPSNGDACPAPDSLPLPRALRASEDLQGFSRLCNAATEAFQVQQALPEARVLMRQEATEEAVKGLYSPRILHLATHGFVTGSLDWPPEWFRVGDYGLWWTRQDYDVMDDDAWLHAGLVFAGVNPRAAPAGMMTGSSPRGRPACCI